MDSGGVELQCTGSLHSPAIIIKNPGYNFKNPGYNTNKRSKVPDLRSPGDISLGWNRQFLDLS